MNQKKKIIHHRYKLIKLIGEGSMGKVYEAFDSKTKDNKALKLVDIRRKKVPLEAISRFRAEAEILESLKHPHVVRYVDFFSDEEVYGLVTELVPLKNLRQVLKKTKTLSPKAALEFAILIADALTFIHERGLVHLDLKPSNILLDPKKDTIGQLKIVDFGFSKLIGLSRENTGGTLSYMSPEQSGMLQQTIDHRADQYSAGIIFYEVLTGQVPFGQEDSSKLVYQHIAQEPEKPSNINQQVPALFEKIVLKLLSKDPEDRYLTTKGLVADLKKYRRLLNKGVEDPDFVLGEEDHWYGFPQTSPLVGREKVIQKVASLVSPALRKGSSKKKPIEAKIILVDGPVGIGKSRLLSELYNRLGQEEGVLWFYTVKNESYETPFKVARNILNKIPEHFKEAPEEQKKAMIGEMTALLGPRVHYLKDVLPELWPWFEEYGGQRFQIPEAKTQKDYVEVIYDLLSMVSNKMKRLTVFIDDLHFADLPTLKAITHIFSNMKGVPFFLIVSARKEQLPEFFLQWMEQASKEDEFFGLNLTPLDRTMTAELVSRLFSGRLDDSVRFVPALYDISQGNPFFIRFALRTLIDSGQIFYKSGEWKVNLKPAITALGDLSTKDAGPDLLVGWPERHLRILRIGSIFQRSFTFEAIKSILAQVGYKTKEKQILEILDRALKFNLIDVDSQRLYTFGDYQLKQNLYQSIESKRKQKLHRAVANYLVQRVLPESADAVYDIGYHFEQAHDKSNAFHYYLMAAEQTDDSSFSNRQSAIYFGLCAKLLEELPKSKVDAATAFDVLYKSIRYRMYSTEDYEPIRKDLKRLEKRVGSVKTRKLRLLTLKTMLSFSLGQKKQMLKYGQEVIDLGTEPEDEPYIIETYHLMGNVVSDKSYEERVELLTKALEMTIKNKKLEIYSVSTSIRGLLLCYLGRFKEAFSVVEESFSIMNQNRFVHSEFDKVWSLVTLHNEAGNFEEVLRYAKQTEQKAENIDFNNIALRVYWSLLAHAQGMLGQYKESLMNFEKVLQSDLIERSALFILPPILFRMNVALKMDEPETALAFFEKAQETLRKRPDPYMDVRMNVLAAVANMNLLQYEEAQRLLGKVKNKVRKLKAPLIECHFQFAVQRLNWFLKRDKKYIYQAEKQLQQLRKMGAQGYYELYKEDLNHWSVHSTQSPSTSKSYQIGGDLFLELFQINKKITSIMDLDQLLVAVLEGAMRMTGANQGYLFTCHRIEVRSDKMTQPCLQLTRDEIGRPLEMEKYRYSRHIVDHVMKNKQTVITRDARKEGRWKNVASIEFRELRSILAVPIVFSGKTTGLIYLENDKASSVFSLKDKEVVETYATQVAIAMNNAENYTAQQKVLEENKKLLAEIKEYSQTLEQKVEQRTRQIQTYSEELKELNQNLEERVKCEIEKRRENEQLLIQQSKMAAMGEMISMIAHQWRQPLASIAAISGNIKVQAALGTVKVDSLGGSLEEIERQTQYLSETINDFRNFLSPKKMVEETSLQTVVQNSLQIIGKSLENAKIKVELDLHYHKQTLTFPNELIQVVINILKNAQDIFKEKKPPQPKILLKGGEDESCQWLAIEDNAGGIPQENLDKVFEPYFSTKDQKLGTGLGLYMSKTIVERHCGGRLLADNKNEGACFTIRIPLKDPGT